MTCSSTPASRCASSTAWSSRKLKKSASRITPYLTTSARPARYSRSGSVSSTEVSTSTPAGCQKAPTMFLPPARFTPTLPPTELSTCASSVVGTCTKVSPRANVAATNPARSPTTPPPIAMTTDLRSVPSSSSLSHNSAALATDLVASPGSTTNRSTVAPACDRLLATATACGCSTFASVMITAWESEHHRAACAPRSARLSAPISIV